MKTVLFLVDGMTPASVLNCPKAQEILKESASDLGAQTVMPSVTLPCHVSLFHSVDPARHGTTTNVYAPQVRPINGLCEVLSKFDKTSSFYYNWEELRDLARPGSLAFSYCCNGETMGYDRTNRLLTDAALHYMPEFDTDFTFIYLGDVDHVGHTYGWMGAEYQESVNKSWDHIDRVIRSLPADEEYTILITADHGGHDRTHGTDLPSDMTIPIIIKGKDFTPGSTLTDTSIKDLAPTIVKLLGALPDKEWEGKSLL